jgi:5-methylcytosine-specific restriction enzyme subunit McrC
LEKPSGHNIFQAFEHSAYNTKNEGKECKILPQKLFVALRDFAGDKDLPWYTLTANGVRFHQFVGAIQIGRYCIEVLPKIDRTSPGEESAQRVLIEMLKQSGFISVKTPTESNLRLKQNFILETYIRMFLDETWEIFHRGLIKYYRKEEGNNNSLKGSILFSKQISKNNIHAERFYVRFSIYDKEHPLNRIIYKTLRLITKLPVSQDAICSSLAQLNLFPELKDIKVKDELFNNIRFNRKTEAYRKAINIARLLLLNYHPDLSHGRNNVLALMFDMNDVWEAWFTRRLALASKKHDERIFIRAQVKRIFWTGETGERINQKPDIIVEVNDKPLFIIDTKWKIIDGRPSEEDIRQMFAYNRLFGSSLAFLAYPGESRHIQGEFYDPEENGECGLLFIHFIENGRLTGKGIDHFLEDFIRPVMS